MMTKFLLLPLILVGCTAPVTDPPAHALEVEGGVEQWIYMVDYLKNYHFSSNTDTSLRGFTLQTNVNSDERRE